MLLKIIFALLVVICVSAIFFYLFNLVVVFRKLIQAFWASIEDEN